MFTSTFLKDMSERALATFAQALVAVVGADAVSWVDIGIGGALKAALIAGVLSALKSIAAAKAPFGDDSASLVDLTK